MSQKSISSSASQHHADIEKIRATMLEKRNLGEKEHNRRALVRIKILILACTGISILWTLYIMGSLDSTSFYRCGLFSEEPVWNIALRKSSIPRDRSLPCPTNPSLRILKKGKLLSDALFPNYYPASDTNVWMGGRDRMRWPEYPILTWLFYIVNFRDFMSWGCHIFAIIVIFDAVFLRNIAQALGIKWIIHKFTLRDLYFVPVVGFFVAIPWEYIVPYYLFGIGGMIDNNDRRDISYGLQYLVISWIPLWTATAKWRSTSLIRRVLWRVYSLFCAVWFGLIVYINIFGGNKVEVKMFEMDNGGLKN